MKFDLRILRVYLAGAVLGSGASYLFSADPRAQYVFVVCLVGWLAMILISRVGGKR